MLFFLLAGIWNALLTVFNFMRLFNERTFTEAADALPTYLAACIACFAILWLLQKIKSLEKHIDDLYIMQKRENPTDKTDSNTNY